MEVGAQAHLICSIENFILYQCLYSKILAWASFIKVVEKDIDKRTVEASLEVGTGP